MPFLEERLPITMRLGVQYQELFMVDAGEDSGGNRYTKLISPIPQYVFTVDYTQQKAELSNGILSLYRRV